MNCERCPLASKCRGEEIPRLCELIDPDHPDYEPAYIDALEPTPPDPHEADESPPDGPGCCPPPIL